MKTLFLTGYGLSLSVKNTRLVFKQGIVPFSKREEEMALEKPDGFQRIEEITIMKMKCIELKGVCCRYSFS